MGFKMKSALKFGQKSAFKMKNYSPAKQSDKNSPEEANPKKKLMAINPKTEMLKEWLIEERGFDPVEADQMIETKAYTFKDMMRDLSPKQDLASKKGKNVFDFDKTMTDEAVKLKTVTDVTKSPLEQEGPIDKQNPKLGESEHPGTWVYPGGDKSERINDLEDRIEFIREDIWNAQTGPIEKDGVSFTDEAQGSNKQKKDLAKLRQELAILRKSTHPNKMKESPNKQGLIINKETIRHHRNRESDLIDGKPLTQEQKDCLNAGGSWKDGACVMPKTEKEGCTPPPNGCPEGQVWDSIECICKAKPDDDATPNKQKCACGKNKCNCGAVGKKKKSSKK